MDNSRGKSQTPLGGHAEYESNDSIILKGEI